MTEMMTDLVDRDIKPVTIIIFLYLRKQRETKKVKSVITQKDLK